MTVPATRIIPAATLIVLRERDAADPELLMIERAAAMAFAGGATVFPGGRIDPGDRALAAILAPDEPDEAAARIAAIRETLEEVGLAIGFVEPPSADVVVAMRRALHSGEAIAAVLADAGVRLDLDALVPFARWRPDHPLSRVYDTRFYLARAGDGVATVDATETVRLGWAGAAEWLAAADRAELFVIFPTRRNLERLALFGTWNAATADARAHPVRLVTPWEEDREGERWLCIPDDLGYPITAQRLDAVRRG